MCERYSWNYYCKNIYALLLSLPSIYSKEGKENEFRVSLKQHLKTLVRMPMSCLLS